MNEKKNFKWPNLLREPKFVPENKKLDDLLKEFQEEKTHIAIVVDEYGGSSGIVSLEDVLEEIVGDITDEFDEEDINYKKLDELNYIFDGKTTLIDVYKLLEIDGEIFEKEKGESDTIAGFCIEQAGKIMLKNEKISFDKYTITVEAADKRRIKKVKLRLMKWFNIAFIFLILILSSCRNESTYPKPKSYLRIDLPEKGYYEIEKIMSIFF